MGRGSYVEVLGPFDCRLSTNPEVCVRPIPIYFKIMFWVLGRRCGVDGHMMTADDGVGPDDPSGPPA